MKIATAGVLAWALVASPAAAQELATEAAFTINFTSLVVNGEPTIEIGPNRRTGLYEGVLTTKQRLGPALRALTP